VGVRLVGCSPSGFRPRTFEAMLTPRPLMILRRHVESRRWSSACRSVHGSSCLLGSPSRSRFVARWTSAPARPRPRGPSEPPIS